MSEPTTDRSLSPAAFILKDDYEALWTSFSDTMRAWTGQIREWAAGDDDLHPLLQQIQRMPKVHLQSAVWVGKDTPNVGSSTGLFFEHVAAAAIGARIQHRVSGAAAHRNRLGTHVAGKGARKQPDLLLVHEATGRTVVFEFKTSPKSGQITGIENQKASWEDTSADPSVRFFLVAGYADRTVAAHLADLPWASVLRHDGKSTGGRSVDQLVKSAVRHLATA